ERDGDFFFRGIVIMTLSGILMYNLVMATDDTYARVPNQPKFWQRRKLRESVRHLVCDLLADSDSEIAFHSANSFVYAENHQTVKRGMFRKRKYFYILQSRRAWPYRLNRHT